ncbi:GerAB/ArcD/ProY family transporter [Paenisporosarcina sp. OV554]|uniref:GerAB/ArcD/ProY family transporter n=1 Tax=Paenisporosarcina sp. OV554 TaxID=2135694 RepID=UPI000D354453|nr:GerAB/ArcD/ProY family transporter [Paenisporosarcina sp. OV554]PUB11996.1 spore germination protein (amino acid permease) [Paenisporosarcina sp. OV554]
MPTAIKERFLVSPFLVFFLVNSIQIGIGVLGFQRYIAKSAGYDAWIAVLAFGFIVNLLIWMIYNIMKKGNGDITVIHRDLFGKWIGGLFSLFFVVYLLFFTITVLRTFIEVIQVWMFPEIKVWAFSLVFLILTYYVVSGGFRTVTGMSFLGVVLPLYLLLTLWFPLEFANFRNLLPILDHSLKELAISTKDTALSYLGFETLFMFYPFIKQPEKSQKWAHFGALFTTLIYLVLTIVSFGYYSEKQLAGTVWATLSIWKIVEMPFVERFEYIGIATYVLVILPNICLSIWSSSRGVKQLFGVKQHTALIVLLVIIFVVNCLLTNRTSVDMLNTNVSHIGFYIIVLYIPFLFIISQIHHKVRKKG